MAASTEPASSLLGAATPVLTPIISVGLSALVARYYTNRHTARHTGEAVLIDQLRAQIHAIRDLTLSYWSKAYRGDGEKATADRAEAVVEAMRIKADIFMLNAEVRVYAKRYKIGADLGLLVANVQDACTNGDFESADRDADLQRYIKVTRATNHLRSTLLDRRV